MLKKMLKESLKVMNFKLTDSERDLLKKKADQYTNGNVSEWIRYASINHSPSKSQLTK